MLSASYWDCCLQQTHTRRYSAEADHFPFLAFFSFLFYYVHIPSSKIIKKDNDTETRANVTTIEQGLQRDAAVMVGH